MQMWLRLIALCLSTASLGGCATNTMTGRSQLSLVSESAAASKATTYYSSMMTDLNKKKKVVTDPVVLKRIEGITNRLIQQAVLYQPQSSTWDWQVKVIDDDETVNAFCMPGGLMAIYTGFMKKLDATDDEIGQVMGHEIGHALAGHGAEKMSVQTASNIGVLLVSIALAKDNKDFQATNNLLTAGALAFINLPNSRDAENEADKLGIELAARAGFSPASAAHLWSKMATVSKSKGRADFLSTHPAPVKRMENLQALATPLIPLYTEASAKPPQVYDWLNGNRANRPRPDSSSAIAFYSESWESFKAGTIELRGSNSTGHLFKGDDLSKLYASQQWRDLAVHVINANLRLDLNYFYLGKAASGLGFQDAGAKYLAVAKQLQQSDDTTCGKKFMVSCSGVDLNTALQSK